MLFIKSVVAGFVALVLASVLVLVITAAASWPPKGQSVGLDLRFVFGQAYFGAIALVAFAVGFYWEYRKAKR